MQDPITAIECLEAADLLPRNKYDLYRSLGLEGDAPPGLTRGEIIALFVILLVSRRAGEQECGRRMRANGEPRSA
jgi:hypothetical protein